MNALEIAKELVSLLAPGCDRKEIVGSLRRGVTKPKDIEIVAIPHITSTAITDLFGGQVAAEEINHLEAAIYTACLGDWAYDMAIKRNGPRYKRLRHHSGIACDLFLTDVKRWGAIYTIRTGPHKFSQMLVTRARHMGYRVHNGLLHGHTFSKVTIGGKPVEMPCEKGDTCPLIIPTLTEETFFSALKVEWLAPELRT